MNNEGDFQMMFFIPVATVLCLFMGVVWKRSDWINTTIKVIFHSVAMWGVVLSYQTFIA